MVNKIIELIHKGYEGAHWDFKQCYHKNKAQLIHDIVCMSNVVTDGDRYIIFGVSDPSEGTEIIGVEYDDNRREQCGINNLLSSISFAGDIRPIVELKTLIISEHEIDVLIIKDSTDIPVYLSSDYRDRDKCLRANYIYSRVGDMNTAINQSTDLYYVEKCGRKDSG